VSPAERTRRASRRPPRRVVALVPALNEEETVGRTVKALSVLDAITEVVVIDDGSWDRTAGEASEAGARVLRSTRNLGKGLALDGALARVVPADIYLFIDADVGETAREAGALVAPVLTGELDLAVGTLPTRSGGGFGLVRGTAAWMIARVGAFRPGAPLSGQRAVRRETLEACRPLAGGFGVETAMTMDAVRLGYRVGEVQVGRTHRATGRGLAGFGHRGRQGWDILQAGLPRLAGLR